jgi:hypothetical protein
VNRDVVINVAAAPDSGPLVVSVRGRLDADGGRRLCQALDTLLEGDTTSRGVEVDVGGVERYTAEGLTALAACTRLGGERPVRLRVGGRSG